MILFMWILAQFGAISPEAFPIQIISDVLMYIAAALTVASGVKYLYDYREFIDPAK